MSCPDRFAAPDRRFVPMFALAALATLIGCTNQRPGAPDEPTEAETKLSLDAMREDARDLAKADLGCREDADCVALGLGDKPCGGHWEYVVYSRTSDSAHALVTLATELNEAEDEFNKTFSIGSDCAYLTEPSTECSQDECVLSAER